MYCVTGFSIFSQKSGSKKSWDKARRKSTMEIWLTALLSFLGMPACTSWRCGRFLSPLNSHLFHHCHSLLCGSDNGSNYIFVPHHNHSMGGMWYHKAATQTGPQDRICCKACTTKDAQTSGNKMMFVKLVMESFSFLFFFCCSFHPYSLGKYFTKLECIMQFQWDLLESSLLALLR